MESIEYIIGIVITSSFGFIVGRQNMRITELSRRITLLETKENINIAVDTLKSHIRDSAPSTLETSDDIKEDDMIAVMTLKDYLKNMNNTK